MSYELTSDELRAIDFARGRYLWADIAHANTQDNTLTLDYDAQIKLSEALSTEGLPLLNPLCSLYAFLVGKALEE
jgi:hypothetical protein